MAQTLVWKKLIRSSAEVGRSKWTGQHIRHRSLLSLLPHGKALDHQLTASGPEGRLTFTFHFSSPICDFGPPTPPPQNCGHSSLLVVVISHISAYLFQSATLKIVLILPFLPGSLNLKMLRAKAESDRVTSLPSQQPGGGIRGNINNSTSQEAEFGQSQLLASNKLDLSKNNISNQTTRNQPITPIKPTSRTPGQVRRGWQLLTHQPRHHHHRQRPRRLLPPAIIAKRPIQHTHTLLTPLPALQQQAQPASIPPAPRRDITILSPNQPHPKTTGHNSPNTPSKQHKKGKKGEYSQPPIQNLKPNRPPPPHRPNIAILDRVTPVIQLVAVLCGSRPGKSRRGTSWCA